MPIETRPLLNFHEPVIDILVGVHEARRRAVLRVHNVAVPRVETKAVIDTGSWYTFIDKAIIAELGIGSVDEVDVQPIAHEESPQRFEVFPVSLFFPGPAQSATEASFLDVMVLGCHCDTGDGVRVILGRDMLQHCIFFYDGTGKTFSIGY